MKNTWGNRNKGMSSRAEPEFSPIYIYILTRYYTAVSKRSLRIKVKHGWISCSSRNLSKEFRATLTALRGLYTGQYVFPRKAASQSRDSEYSQPRFYKISVKMQSSCEIKDLTELKNI